MIDQSEQIGCYVASRIDSYKTNSRSLPYFFACWLQLVVIVAVLLVSFLFLSFSSAPHNEKRADTRNPCKRMPTRQNNY